MTALKPKELVAELEEGFSALAGAKDALAAWLSSPEYRQHLADCARWAADDPRLVVGHVGSYG